MKSDVVSGLLNASWPVLIVEATGIIRNSNAEAVKALGTNLSRGLITLGPFWPPDNPGTPAEFLSGWKPTPEASMAKLRAAGGQIFQAWVTTFTHEGSKLFLFQLLPEKTAIVEKPAAAPSAPAATPAAQATSATAAPASSLDAGLAHKQKLDCALQLARTVSLDFNNALTSILGHTSLVLSKMEPTNPWRHSLMEVEKSAAKAAEIANDLAAFSRAEKEAKVQAAGNLNLLLERNVETFRAMKLEKDVTWSLQLERRLYGGKFDEAKMQQALLKIIENAVESLNTRGRVILTTKNIDLTEATQDRNVRLAAGAYVCAEITDDGGGIAADVLPRIFEPFFTTKRAPHRGLGLAWVYGVVTNNGGGVAVSSEPGNGTSVRVYVPADKRVIRETVGNLSDLNGTETVLMVDDEDLLLTMGQAILSSYGYRVLTANSGRKALEIFAKGDPHVDLLITDLVMPHMSGRELVEEVHQISPDTRILCTSGYVRPTSEEQEQAAYLQKPFTSQELLMKVKHALASGQSAAVD